MQAWQEIARDPGPHRHVVQVYRDEPFLVSAVTAWLARALAKGGGVVILATPEHARALRASLADEGFDVARLEAAERFLVADAEETLARFMRDGSPQPALFRATIHLLLSRLPPRVEVRAWGEMVDILRRRGEAAAARRLESLWNDILGERDVHLLCSYQLDNLDTATHVGTALADVCEGHSVLLPEADDRALEKAVDAALLQVFGETEGAMMRTLLARERVLAIETVGAEHVLASLGRRYPDLAERVVRIARERISG